MAKHDFPETIFVTRDEDTRDEDYYQVEGTSNDAEPLRGVSRTQACAEYRLVRVGKAAVDRAFVADPS